MRENNVSMLKLWTRSIEGFGSKLFLKFKFIFKWKMNWKFDILCSPIVHRIARENQLMVRCHWYTTEQQHRPRSLNGYLAANAMSSADFSTVSMYIKINYFSHFSRWSEAQLQVTYAALKKVQTSFNSELNLYIFVNFHHFVYISFNKIY